VRLGALEAERAVEGAVGALLLAAVLAVFAVALTRRWVARRRAERADPGVPALARFADIETDDAIAFGGGAASARVRRRRDTVVYGYLAVAEEYVGGDGGAWCTLTVALPGRVPFLVIDAVQAGGRVGVPLEAPRRERVGAAAFDAAYVVGVAEPGTAGRVLTPGAQTVLLTERVQRLMLHGRSLVLRTFDGVRLDLEAMSSLQATAAGFLTATPSFVRSSLAVSGPAPADAPLPPGRYGPDTD
jgi:hypothetical protein